MRYPKLPYLLLALAVLIGDQVTKWLVETRLAGSPPREVSRSSLMARSGSEWHLKQDRSRMGCT